MRAIRLKRSSDDVTLTRASDGFTVEYAASTRHRTRAIFQQPGTLATGTGTFRFYVWEGFTIQRVHASVATDFAGSSIIVDVNVNGTTIFTTQANRPTITVNSHVATGTPTVTSVVAGDYFTVDIDQVGSIVPGNDLVVQIELIQ